MIKRFQTMFFIVTLVTGTVVVSAVAQEPIDVAQNDAPIAAVPGVIVAPVVNPNVENVAPVQTVQTVVEVPVVNQVVQPEQKHTDCHAACNKRLESAIDDVNKSVHNHVESLKGLVANLNNDVCDLKNDNANLAPRLVFVESFLTYGVHPRLRRLEQPSCPVRFAMICKEKVVNAYDVAKEKTLNGYRTVQEAAAQKYVAVKNRTVNCYNVYAKDKVAQISAQLPALATVKAKIGITPEREKAINARVAAIKNAIMSRSGFYGITAAVGTGCIVYALCTNRSRSSESNNK